MVEPKFPPFLSPGSIANIQQLIRRGYSTAEQLNDRPVIVQIRRYNQALGRYEDFGLPVSLVSLTFGLREVFTSGGTPIVEEHSDGDFVTWEDVYQPIVGDRFIREGMVCEVTTVYPPEFGVITAEVSLKQISPQSGP